LGGPESQIKGWYDCGQLQFPTETPPDIHPINAWRVTKRPSEGNTYLGMVIRDNDSWEAVTQRLPIPMQEGKCYAFNVDLSRSNFYISGSKITRSMENYTNPAVLRIHGGTGVCGRQEQLGESTTVTNDEWRTYEFKFEPSRTVNYLTLEAFYKTPTLIPYNGHILVDNASLIVEIPCDEEQLEFKESTPEDVPLITSEEKINKPSKKTAPVPIAELLEEEDIERNRLIVTEEIVSKPEPGIEEKIEGLEKKKYFKGDIIPIHNIYFSMDSASVKGSSRGAIEQLVKFMDRNQNIVIEVGGHTNTAPPSSYCDELSSRRAKEVAKLLASRGVPPNRLRYRGYGKRKPLVNNDLKDFEARAKNQRVEIKILQTDFSSGTG
ncbi:MAG: outer membrane protein OmpA-like peptidoglycan-associated protein, partial [Saprospiraceae bacterium]